MVSIVVTGATRGIGFGMAHEFLRRGHKVTLCGRTQECVDRAIANLETAHGPDRAFGLPCDVRHPDQVQALWDGAVGRFGPVDIWINNAGINAPRRNFWELLPEQMDDVVRTNVLGLMYGSRIAMRGMLEQGGGQIYNMEGLGSSGPALPGTALYGATKSAVTYCTGVLIKEATGTPVRVGYLSPGMVMTQFLTRRDGAELSDGAKRVMNILADKVETVTPYLVERILANDRHGVRIAWLIRPKIAWRFLTAPFRKRDLFAEL